MYETIVLLVYLTLLLGGLLLVHWTLKLVGGIFNLFRRTK